tara:strand:- start:1764 stop:1961 length:198 start_codon:yes stop_codon:yes gene_type:complete
LKVGDLVQWYTVYTDLDEKFIVDVGIILELSRTGFNTLSALVLFEDNTTDWISTETLEVIISEDR